MKILPIILHLLFTINVFSQLPSTDIVLGEVTQRGDDFKITNLKNVTARTGYDNQPFFSEDGNFFYFSSDRDGPQTDIYIFDLRKRSIERLTNTVESEYSPTPIPSMTSFSVVRVDADSAQHLYRYLPDGTNPVILYTGSEKIGYHNWVDANRIIFYSLDETNSIRILNLSEQETTHIADNGGRSVHRIPEENSVSFTIRIDSLQWQIKKFDGAINKVETIADLPPGVEDYSWLNASTIVAGNKGKIYFFNLNKKENGWKLMADLSNTAFADFYRIAFDLSGKKVAFVIKN